MVVTHANITNPITAVAVSLPELPLDLQQPSQLKYPRCTRFEWSRGCNWVLGYLQSLLFALSLGPQKPPGLAQMPGRQLLACKEPPTQLGPGRLTRSCRPKGDAGQIGLRGGQSW